MDMAPFACLIECKIGQKQILVNQFRKWVDLFFILADLFRDEAVNFSFLSTLVHQTFPPGGDTYEFD